MMMGRHALRASEHEFGGGKMADVTHADHADPSLDRRKFHSDTLAAMLDIKNRFNLHRCHRPHGRLCRLASAWAQTRTLLQ